MLAENINNYLNEKSYSIGFFNPYDEEDNIKMEPISLNDIGDKLEKQKEAFNAPATEVIRVKNGYIVRATENFRKGDIVERAPVILQTSDILRFPQLKDIVFEIDKEEGLYGLVLGNGSLYSHSDHPNLDYAWDKTKSRMCFITRKKIAKGEILTINYGFDYWQERMPAHMKTNIDNTIQTANNIAKLVDENNIDPNAISFAPKFNKINTNDVTINQPQNFTSNPVNTGQPILSQ